MEKEVWLGYKGKIISVTKKISDDNSRFFKGVLIDVLEDKIILKDRKIHDDILLSFEGLSLVGVE